MTTLYLLAGFVLGMLSRFLLRIFAPTVSVACVNGVWLATVTGVLGRHEFVRSSRSADRFAFARPEGRDRAFWWRHIRTGKHAPFGLCLRFDGLVRVFDCTKPLREVEA